MRALYEAILDHEGERLSADVLEPAIARLRERVRALDRYRALERMPRDEDLRELYALSRVNDLLLEPFQETAALASKLPRVSQDEYVAFFEALGFRPFFGRAFNPIHHEIVEVREVADPASRVDVDSVLWPGLSFGTLVFSRAGVRVAAPRSLVDPEVAASSTLYFTFRRLRRPVHDRSHGWGSNSQWRTSFSRNYDEGERLHWNVDGTIDLADPASDAGEDELTLEQRRELLIHRCFVRTSLSEAGDHAPYDDRLTLRSGVVWPLDEALLVRS